MPYNYNPDNARFALLVGYGGKILINQHNPESVGKNFLDWAADPDSRKRLEEGFAKCFALGEEVHGVVADIDAKKLQETITVLVKFKPWMPWRHEDEVLIEAIRVFSGVSLSQREEELLNLVADGISTATCAEAMGLDVSTISTMKSNMRKKLGVETDVGLVTAAAALGFRHV